MKLIEVYRSVDVTPLIVDYYINKAGVMRAMCQKRHRMDDMLQIIIEGEALNGFQRSALLMLYLRSRPARVDLFRQGKKIPFSHQTYRVTQFL